MWHSRKETKKELLPVSKFYTLKGVKKTMKSFKLLSLMNVRTVQMITWIPPGRGGEALVLDSRAHHMAF